MWTDNPAAGRGRKMFVLSDPSHGIKKKRNSMMSRKRCLMKKTTVETLFGKDTVNGHIR